MSSPVMYVHPEHTFLGRLFPTTALADIPVGRGHRLKDSNLGLQMLLDSPHLPFVNRLNLALQWGGLDRDPSVGQARVGQGLLTIARYPADRDRAPYVRYLADRGRAPRREARTPAPGPKHLAGAPDPIPSGAP
jgi:hypothetical protein